MSAMRPRHSPTQSLFLRPSRSPKHCVVRAEEERSDEASSETIPVIVLPVYPVGARFRTKRWKAAERDDQPQLFGRQSVQQ